MQSHSTVKGPAPSRATIKDVARASGVNISTVSRALSGAYGVHEDTRERVREAAAHLGYRPNRVARGLVTGRSHTLGLIVSDIRNPFFAELTRGAEDAARAGGCDLMLCNSDLDPAKQMERVMSLSEKRVDGILLNPVVSLTRKQREQLVACGVPIVLLNQPDDGSNFSVVATDNAAGGVLAAEHLLKLGHLDIGHLTGPADHRSLADRARGFARRIRAAGPRRHLLVMHGENSFLGGYELTRDLLRKRPSITAIFAGNDMMAFGAVRAILDGGRRVPDDISLIGYDNVELASVVYPPLTTIHQPQGEMGRRAVEILLRGAREGPAAAIERVILGVELVERQSCRTRI